MDLFLIALDHHHSIIDAIANREGTRAETLAREHARVARRNLDAALGNSEIWKTIRGAKLIELGRAELWGRPPARFSARWLPPTS
jgi:GntR family transcriptional regulator, vanillate catabolism transcriptional regulator